MSQRLSIAKATEKAERLEQRVVATAQAYRDAREAVGREWLTARDLATPLAEQAKQRRHAEVRSHDRRARELTLELLDRIRAREGLLLEPLDPTRPAVGLRIADVGPQRAVEDAKASADRARRERDAFAEEYEPMLRAAEAKESMRQVKAALKASDPEVLRDALAAVGVQVEDD